MGAGQTIPNYTSNPLNGGNYTMLTLRIGASTSNPITTLPTALITHNPWKASDAQTTRSLVFMSMNMGPTAIQGPFVINNAHFDMDVINFKVPFENIEIWELRNQTPIGHPFHIHNVPFYILDINGVQPAEHLRGKKDVVHVPAGNGTVRFITRFEDFYNDTLPYMYHCHILTHEDDGMMGQFIVQSPCAQVIQQEPSDALREIGETAVFSVQTSGSGHTYQWQTDAGLGWQSLSNAGQYSGVTTASLTVANVSAVNHNQLFRCLIRNNDCNYTSQPVRISVPSLGLEHPAKPGLALYPNPARDLLQVRLDWPAAVQYQLCDLKGRILLKGTLRNATETLSLKGLQPGVYLFAVPELALRQKVWKEQ
jgi:hypothetical protein